MAKPKPETQPSSGNSSAGASSGNDTNASSGNDTGASSGTSVSNTLGGMSADEADRLKLPSAAPLDDKPAELRTPLVSVPGEPPALTGNLLDDVAARSGLSYEAVVAGLADLLRSKPLMIEECEVAGSVDIGSVGRCILDLYKVTGHPVPRAEQASLDEMAKGCPDGE